LGKIEYTIDEETQRVLFIATIKYEDFFTDAEMISEDGTPTAALVGAFYLQMTLEDLYEFFKNPNHKIVIYADAGRDVMVLDLNCAYTRTKFDKEEAQQILEALLKHNGEYDLEIHIDPESTFSSSAVSPAVPPIVVSSPEEAKKIMGKKQLWESDKDFPPIQRTGKPFLKKVLESCLKYLEFPQS
jgi:hypothetical protein